MELKTTRKCHLQLKMSFTKKTTNAGKEIKKRAALYTPWESKLGHIHTGEQHGGC